MTSDASEDPAGSNPGSEGQGGDGGDSTEKVAAILKEAGLDLDTLIADRVKEAVSATAAEVGQAAQKKYDKTIQQLRTETQKAREEAEQLRRDTRTAQLASLPPAERKAAEALFQGEENVRRIAQREQELGEAARYITAEKMVVDLAKKGIDREVEEFLDLGSPEAMLAKAAEIRAEVAEKALKDRLEGKTEDKKEASEKKPPAGSTKSGTPKPGTGQAPPSGKPWADLKGKGFDRLAEGLGKMAESDHRGVKE